MSYGPTKHTIRNSYKKTSQRVFETKMHIKINAPTYSSTNPILNLEDGTNYM